VSGLLAGLLAYWLAGLLAWFLRVGDLLLLPTRPTAGTGHEQYGKATRYYYKEAHGAFICIDLSSTENAAQHVRYWFKDLCRGNSAFADGSLPIIVLANKCDLTSDPRGPISNEEAALTRELGLAGAFRTSAKLDINLNLARDALVKCILSQDSANTADSRSTSATLVCLLRFDGAGGLVFCFFWFFLYFYMC
jgi:hypothetical protein